MTCDNNRPCERCVARGLADTCRDGVRKKAKYLADVPEAVARSEESLKYDPRYNIKGKGSKAKSKTTIPQQSQSQPAANTLSGNGSSIPNGQTLPSLSSSDLLKPLMIPESIRQSQLLNSTLKSSSTRQNQHTSGNDQPMTKTSVLENYGAPETLLSINTSSTSPFNSVLTTLPSHNQPLHNFNGNNTSNSSSNSRRRSNMDNISNDARHNNSAPLLPPLGTNLLNPDTNHSDHILLPSQHHEPSINSANNNVTRSEHSNNHLNDNDWPHNIRPSRHNFQSMAVNMEYSVISNIINTSLTSPSHLSLDMGANGPPGGAVSYSPSLSSNSGDSPSFLTRGADIYGTPNSNSNSTGGNHNGFGSISGQTNQTKGGEFKLNNLNQYALGIPYTVPSSIAGMIHGLGSGQQENNMMQNGGSALSGYAQSLPELVEMVDTLKQVQFSQRQQQALTAGTQPWMVPEISSGPKRPLSFVISTRPFTPQNSPAQTPLLGPMGMDSGPGFDNSNNYGGMSSDNWIFRKYSEPADIYANVRQPYSYTPAYHQLTIYIRTRFSREQQLKIARCMASYRPSFIACTNTLKEDDLIFMEQCFQRTLLEYEKFISYSGTPTAVWRRTGQISAVGTEFCALTGWPRDRLLSEHTFIVELMDDNSVLEYFEMFSKMAFGDSRGANMSECTLLTPNGKKIKTSSIWTLKRDVFGIPMMIVGNFLPILDQ